MASISPNADDYQRIFTAFLEVYKKQIEQNKKSLPFNFNILDAQCGTIKENSHTNILMKLLDYKYKYGGYVFLNDFIKLAGFNIQIDNSSHVIFKTEFFGIVQNKDQGKKGRIDGVIYKERDFAIIIENKINKAPNQKAQLKRYIETVLNDKIVEDTSKIYVVFLTKDGVEKPDNDSIEYMRGNGILNQLDSKKELALISGPRYFACSYRHNILPWLESDVQPLVFQKDSTLNAGLLQYIDFLKGMMGQREGQTLLQEQCKQVLFTDIIKLSDINNLNKQIDYLHNLYKHFQTELMKYQKKSDNDSKIQVECISLLQNLLYKKAEEPMKVFMEATKKFFTSSQPPLIDEENYRVNHHFTFYYIDIRDKNWPKGVYIGWCPAHLLNKKPYAFLYYQKTSDKKTNDGDKNGDFTYHERPNAWRKKYDDIKDIQNIDEQVLMELYQNSGIIKVIEEIKSTNNT